MVNARLELADYRRRVAQNYLRLAGSPPAEACATWRAGRDALFLTHAQSPLTPEQKATVAGLPYFSYDEAFRMPATLHDVSAAVSDLDAGAGTAAGVLSLATGGVDGVVECEPVGVLEFAFGSLTLYWIRGYAGGLFLPFRDGTGNTRSYGDSETYGGGRYLADTMKGTFGGGLVIDGDQAMLDFNFAYNPSCAYNSAYACPLAPRCNWLTAGIRAGEKAFAGAV